MTENRFWRDRNVFVTGCTGLLGSWLTERLVEEGANVVGLIRDRVPRSRLIQKRVVERINVVSGQVEDYLLLERCLNEYEVQTVFHLAAQTIVKIANTSPISTFNTNIGGTWNLLEACRRVGQVQEIVVASSDKAYGAHTRLPYEEETALLGRHPYDVSKSCADMLAQGYAETYQLPLCITRFGNLFGGGDLNFSRLIPGTVRSVLRGEEPVVRSNGQFSRDYIYVEDAVLAYMLLAEKMGGDRQLLGQAFNFSYECPQKAIDVVDTILALMERTNLRPVIRGTATNEIPHQFLAARKARQVLGWSPQFTFESGLRRTIQWYREFFKDGDVYDPRCVDSPA